ncbi:hypothetical protein [Rhizosaccharibacter radicis]|uniref:Uncharacterized protein n=1 Tax=Rhizosaccharibacter radicis TaxID=2782605 RepID=A0ABT1VT01_9PROT|nr:hypothetical protein [Acetobacteraceae bacterium KSS12]
MFSEALSGSLLRVLDRPDLRIVADHQDIRFDPTLDTPFRADPAGRVVLGAACTLSDRIGAFHLRHALELSMLLDAAARSGAPDVRATAPAVATVLPIVEPPARTARADTAGTVATEFAPCDLPVLAGLCAARVAALFWRLDEVAEPPAPGGWAATGSDPAAWVAVMAAPDVPSLAVLGQIWPRLRGLQGSPYRLLRAACLGDGGDEDAVPEAVRERLAACWSLIGPVEALMAGGGDNRLAVDPRTGLNHYGCSHRPRPWAISFASSTASSLSERGFGGAEAARKRLATAALRGTAAIALVEEMRRVRTGVSSHFGLDAVAGAETVLAPSGTDCELIALAVAARMGTEPRPVSNVLVAPEETGTGVPLAAAGRHFAADTARARPVRRGEAVSGFPADTIVRALALRTPDGTLRDAAEVDAECETLARAEAAAGRRVLMHRLDLSKTGLLAPGLPVLDGLHAELGDRIVTVVDACQARLDARRVRGYLRRGWMVVVTGSKFFTGPPFCGAVLLPPDAMRALRDPAALPDGLSLYGSRLDWPEGTPAARTLQATPNTGMLLRWSAALAEMQAFAAVPPAEAARRIDGFIAAVEAAVAAHPDLEAVAVPAPRRGRNGEGEAVPGWDERQLIRSILVRQPASELPPGTARRPLDMERARLVYRWLNADLSPALPADATAEEHELAALLCHIGQPAPVAHPLLPGAMAGALRVSVGARLVSGEPSHAALDPDARLRREARDAGRVLNKIGLILRHWNRIAALDPVPVFAADRAPPPRADPGLDI